MALLGKVFGSTFAVPFKVLGFASKALACVLKPVLKLVRGILFAPFNVARFMQRHAILLGSLQAGRLLCRGIFKLFTRPLVVGFVCGGATWFVVSDADRRAKVRELLPF